mmetsp:Transcript_14754/g.39809  ORF Transcript_14754/g.39809 Transcript_14754/m.39809 type:complete len:333 (+) Transcript_14754:709-1707(+)
MRPLQLLLQLQLLLLLCGCARVFGLQRHSWQCRGLRCWEGRGRRREGSRRRGAKFPLRVLWKHRHGRDAGAWHAVSAGPCRVHQKGRDTQQRGQQVRHVSLLSSLGGTPVRKPVHHGPHALVDALVHLPAQLQDGCPHTCQLPLTSGSHLSVCFGDARSLITVEHPGQHLQDVGLAGVFPDLCAVIYHDSQGKLLGSCGLLALQRDGLVGCAAAEHTQGMQQRFLAPPRHIDDALLALLFGNDGAIDVQQAPHFQGVLALRSRAHVHIKPLFPIQLPGQKRAQFIPARPHAQQHAGFRIQGVDACKDDEAILQADDRPLNGAAIFQVSSLKP